MTFRTGESHPCILRDGSTVAQTANPGSVSAPLECGKELLFCICMYVCVFRQKAHLPAQSFKQFFFIVIVYCILSNVLLLVWEHFSLRSPQSSEDGFHEGPLPLDSGLSIWQSRCPSFIRDSSFNLIIMFCTCSFQFNPLEFLPSFHFLLMFQFSFSSFPLFSFVKILHVRF